MNHETFAKVSAELLATATGIADSKRPGYTIGSGDILANFKRCGERAGVSAGQAWAVYFLKHVDAITSIMTRPDLPVSEAAIGRFSDAINYLLLGYAMHREQTAEASMEGYRDSLTRAAQIGQAGSLLGGVGLGSASAIAGINQRLVPAGAYVNVKPAQLEADIEEVRDDHEHAHYVPADKMGAR